MFESSGLLQDTTEIEEKAALRLKQLDALRAEHKTLQQEHDQLKATVSFSWISAKSYADCSGMASVRSRFAGIALVPDIPSSTFVPLYSRQ